MQKKEQKLPAFKVVLIGDSGVGKSSIIQHYISKKFSMKYDTTVGTDFISKNIEIDNLKIMLQIWDTAGQECFRSLIKSFYYNTHAFFIVYDIGNHDTFENVEVWLKEIDENCQKTPIKILVGNKSDLERNVEIEEAEKIMKDNKLHLFFETSAKMGEQIEKVFIEAAKLIILNNLKTNVPEIEIQKNPEPIKIKPQAQETQTSTELTKKNGCC